MAVKIRLTRLGKKKQPTYRVVVMDSRKPRDGRYIEQLGIYDPRQEPSLVKIDNERALYWLETGAQPTERAQKLLEISGAWTQFKVARGDIHTVGASADADVAVSGETAGEKAPKAKQEAAKVEVEPEAVAEEPVGAEDAAEDADAEDADADDAGDAAADTPEDAADDSQEEE